MSCYAGDIANKGTPSELLIWNKLFPLFKDDENTILGYKDPSLGKSVEETPSFIIISKEYGILLLDVIDEEFLRINEDDDNFWILKNNLNTFSRDEINQNFIYEIENRLRQNKNIRKSSSLLQNKINTVVIFSQNTNEIFPSDDIDSRIQYLTKPNIDNLEAFIDKFKIEQNKIDNKLFDEIVSEFDSTNILNKNINKPKTNTLKTMNDFIQESLSISFWFIYVFI